MRKPCSMEETIAQIIENIDFQNKQLFEQLLKKSIHKSNDSCVSSYAVHDNLVFKLDTFFKGLPPFDNEYGKNNKYLAGAHALNVVFEKLGFDLDANECFMLFHLRKLGRFRMKESNLHTDLKKLWSQHPEFTMDDLSFSYGIKNLMRSKIINYRKGNLTLNPSMIIRYKTRS